MRFVVTATVIVQLVTGSSGAARAESRRELCGSLASSLDNAASSAERQSKAFEAMDLTLLTRSGIIAPNPTIARAQETAAKVVPLLREYARALQELNGQLRACAR